MRNFFSKLGAWFVVFFVLVLIININQILTKSLLYGAINVTAACIPIFACVVIIIKFVKWRKNNPRLKVHVSPVRGFFIIIAVFITLAIAWVDVVAIKRWVATKRDPVQAFVDYFDADMAATFPDLAEVAGKDYEFHEKLLARSKQAFIEGGWDGENGVNAVVFPFLETQLAVYEDDTALQALASAHADVLVNLWRTQSFSRCKTLGIAPKTGPTLPPHAPYMSDLVPNLLAIPKKYEQGKQSGQTWQPPWHHELAALWQNFRSGHQPLSDTETRAMMYKTNAEPAIYCQASIKILKNIIDRPTHESSQLYRVLLAHAEDDHWIADLLQP